MLDSGPPTAADLSESIDYKSSEAAAAADVASRCMGNRTSTCSITCSVLQNARPHTACAYHAYPVEVVKITYMRHAQSVLVQRQMRKTSQLMDLYTGHG